MRDRVRCGAAQVNGFQCERQASWWIERHRGDGTKAEPRCSVHVRGWLLAWPMASDSAQADRLRDAAQ